MKISKFQIIFLGTFILFIIVGVAVFATYRGTAQSNQLPSITIWGTYPKQSFDAYVAKVNMTLTTQYNIHYVQESEESFLPDFISALARGSGPDAVLIPADMLLSTEDKLTLVPYSAYPQKDFVGSFIDEARIYLSQNGLLGVPFAVDPLVMYWNRDMYNAAGIALPPKTWDDVSNVNAKITVKDQSGNVSKSAFALGDFTNVDNAREILGALILQTGNSVTKEYSALDVRSMLSPANSPSPTPAVTLFTKFVNPADADYSWNRSWQESRTAFLSGKLANYFGFASELFGIRDKNPNLNFDVTSFPQLKSGGVAATYGKLYGFSITKQTPYANAAFQMIYTLTLPSNLQTLSADTYLPSVSRNVIASGTNDQYLQSFNEQALISKTWLDADPSQSTALFSQMISEVTSGQKTAYQALSDMSNSYDVVLRRAFGQ